MIELIANIQQEIDSNYIYTYDLIDKVSYRIGATARDAITYLLYHKFDKLVSTYQIDYHYRATKLDSLEKDGIDSHTKTYFNDAFTEAGSKKYVLVCGDIDEDENMYAYKISDLMELDCIDKLKIDFKDNNLIEKIRIDSRKHDALELLDLIGVNAGSLTVRVLEDLEAYEVEQMVVEINSFLRQQCSLTDELYLPPNLELEYIFSKIIKNLDEQVIADLYIELNDFLNVEYGLMLDFRETKNINDLFEDNSLSVSSNKIKDIIFKEVSQLDVSQLESELEQVKHQSNEKVDTLVNLAIDEGQGDTLLILGAVMQSIKSVAKNNYTQQSLIDEIIKNYPNTKSISQSTLEKKFARAKTHLNQNVTP